MVVTGAPAGLGEPVFYKLDQLMGGLIGHVKVSLHAPLVAVNTGKIAVQIKDHHNGHAGIVFIYTTVYIL